jgi:threonylcarbamoyladenosine tRNA methylthiotransferase MtaB
MGRHYTQSDIRRVLDSVCEILPNCGLSADWIAGLPGETEAAFKQTAQLIASYPFTGAHVFPYSKRTGTPAATFPNQVPQADIIRRAKHLRDIAHVQQLKQLDLQLGRSLQVIPEQAQGDVRYGWSSERFHVRLPASYPRGKCISVSPSRLENDTLIVTE